MSSFTWATAFTLLALYHSRPFAAGVAASNSTRSRERKLAELPNNFGTLPHAKIRVENQCSHRVKFAIWFKYTDEGAHSAEAA